MLKRRKVLLFLSLPLFAKDYSETEIKEQDPVALHYNAWKDMWNNRAQKPNSSMIIDIKEMKEWQNTKHEFHRLEKIIDQTYKGWK